MKTTKLVAVAALVFLSTSAVWAAPEDTVYFEDTWLKYRVEITLGKSDPTEADMLQLTTLAANLRGIQSIVGLEYAKNLVDLYLNGNKLTDISPLADLINLKQLWLGNNDITDISPLTGLTNLEYLSMEHSQISDISQYAEMTMLLRLNLAYNQISDVSPLGNLMNLKRLDIDHNQITDITPLDGLTSLEFLRVRNNLITHVSLSDLTSLWFLDLGINQITHITLSGPGLINLQSLYLWYNQITDISGLAGLLNLIYLNLDSNQISGISPLAGLANLNELWLNENQISDISPLAGLTNLERCWLNQNQITDISPLAGMTNLYNLGLRNNQVSDISPLADLKNLQHLDMAENKITYIPPLTGATQLEFWLEHNQISDISGLASLISVRGVELSYNNISDIQPLVDNPGMDTGDTVVLYSNPLSYKAVHTDIPILLDRGVEVLFDENPASVIVWTGGDGQDGHFIPEGEDWYQDINLHLAIHTQVLEDDRPVEGATVSLGDRVPPGQTDADGHFRFVLYIDYGPWFPIEAGQIKETVEATWDDTSAKSDPTLLYEVEKLEDKRITMTPDDVKRYQWKLMEQFINAPEVPLKYPYSVLQTLIRYIIYHGLHWGYRVQAGDQVILETYKFTAPDVAPVWLVCDKIIRDGQILGWRNSWTENEGIYLQAVHGNLLARNEVSVTLSSPATLYVTAPDGSHAGYDPSTGLLVRGFCMAISEPGDEPFILLIPNPQQGEYRIQVVPDPDALPTETYSLEVTFGDTTITLAENVAIGSVPENPYVIRVTEIGITPIVSAVVDLNPDTLDLESKGRWITFYIKIPEAYDVSDINVDSILLEGLLEVQHSDVQEDVLMVKFDRQDVIAYISVILGITTPDYVTLRIVGELNDGVSFEGTDVIRVIDEGS